MEKFPSEVGRELRNEIIIKANQLTVIFYKKNQKKRIYMGKKIYVIGIYRLGGEMSKVTFNIVYGYDKKQLENEIHKIFEECKLTVKVEAMTKLGDFWVRLSTSDLSDDDFRNYVYATLAEWGMSHNLRANNRGTSWRSP